MKPLRFAVTPGEPAGIGPDLCLLLAADAQPHPLIAITSRDLLAERATQLGLAVNLLPVIQGAWPDQPAPAGSLYVWDTPLTTPDVPGQLDKANAAFVLQTLTRAGQGCLDGHFAGMITAPVHKGVINESGIAFSGHTEFLADLTHTNQVVMMLATHGLRVALVTTHLPLRDVADAIVAEGGQVERSAVVLDKPIKTLGMHPVKIKLHPEVTITVTVNVARSNDEAERQARGENVIQSQFEEDRQMALEQAEELFEGGAGQAMAEAPAEEA